MEEYPDLKRSKEVEKGEGMVVHPGEFVLGSTLESLKLPNNMVARIEGRSSYARLGLIPHTAAGFVDAGFEG